MNVAVLDAKWSPCAEPMDQMVVPATGLPPPSVQVKAVPPHSWTSIPRCRLYQACSALASLALKKMPPMPVTRFTEPPRTGGGERSVFLRRNVSEFSCGIQVYQLNQTALSCVSYNVSLGIQGTFLHSSDSIGAVRAIRMVRRPLDAMMVRVGDC